MKENETFEHKDPCLSLHSHYAAGDLLISIYSKAILVCPALDLGWRFKDDRFVLS